MPDKNIHQLKDHRGASERPDELQLILHSSSDNSHHRFQVPPDMQVSEFLELALDRLAEGEGAERVAALRRYYQPVLELEGEGQELPLHLTLAEAGVNHEAVCRIAARPLKERIMFCSYG
jgi:hypothetical protein